MHVGDDDVAHVVGFDAERLEPLADRMADLAGALLGRRLVKAGVDDKDAVRSFDDPDVIRDRGHVVVRIAEHVVVRALAPVASVFDGIDLVDFVAHGFFSAPMVTPARFSIILTIAVKSLSPPYSALVASHSASTVLMTSLGESSALASSLHSRTSLSINAVPKP